LLDLGIQLREKEAMYFCPLEASPWPIKLAGADQRFVRNWMRNVTARVRSWSWMPAAATVRVRARRKRCDHATDPDPPGISLPAIFSCRARRAYEAETSGIFFYRFIRR
jgi:hypothetical protein